MEKSINFIGLKELGDDEQERVKDMTTKYYEKFIRTLKETTSFSVHVKEYKKEGGNTKYSIHVRINVPGKILEVEKADWDLARTLHKVFDAMENEIDHHINSQ